MSTQVWKNNVLIHCFNHISHTIENAVMWHAVMWHLCSANYPYHFLSLWFILTSKGKPFICYTIRWSTGWSGLKVPHHRIWWLFLKWPCSFIFLSISVRQKIHTKEKEKKWKNRKRNNSLSELFDVYPRITDNWTNFLSSFWRQFHCFPSQKR